MTEQNKELTYKQHKQYGPNKYLNPENLVRLGITEYAVGTDVFVISSIEVAKKSQTSVKLKEIVFPNIISLYVGIYVEVKVDAEAVAIDLYKNGVEKTQIGISMATEYEVIGGRYSGFIPGDLLQIYGNNPISADEYFYIRNLELRGLSYVRPVTPFVVP